MQKKKGPLLEALLVVAGFFIGNVGASVLLELTRGITGSATVGIVVYLVVYVGICTLFAWLAVTRFGGGSLAAYGLTGGKAAPPMLLMGLALGVVAFLLTVAPLYFGGDYILGRDGYGAYVAVLGFVQYIAVGYAEELLCRGFLQHRLHRLGAVPALCITALIFAALHLFNPNFSLLAFVNIFLAGTFMGAALYAGMGLWMPIGIHITWNWVQGSLLGIPVSGGDTAGLFTTSIVGQNAVVTGGEFGAEGSIYCTVVLVLATLGLLLFAHKTGRMRQYMAQTTPKAKA